MGTKKIWAFSIMILIVIGKIVSPFVAAGSSPHDPALTFATSDTVVITQMEDVLPESIAMVATAIKVLEKGWNGMTPQERALFLHIFDPGDSGEIDAAFVQQVLENMRAIHNRLSYQLTVDYAPESSMCQDMRIYYTNFSKIFVCPYFKEETNPDRMARDLVHEVAHIALKVLDRPYYSETDARYAALSPRGSQAAQLPLVGFIFREIARGDTLYHPDAYPHFAFALVSGAAESGHDQAAEAEAVSDADLTASQQADQKFFQGK